MANFSEEQNRLLDAIRKMEADGVPEDKIRQVVEYAKQKNPSLVGGKAKQQPAFSLAPPPEPKMKGALGAIEAQGIEVPTKPSGETMPDIGKEESRLGFIGRSLKDFATKEAPRGLGMAGSFIAPWGMSPSGQAARLEAAAEIEEVNKQRRQDYPKLSAKPATDVFRNPTDLDAWTAAASTIMPTAAAMITAPLTGVGSAAALTGGYFGSSLANSYTDGIKSGLDDTQSMLYGTVMGSIEAAAENLGLDALTKIPKSWLSKTVKESVKKYGKEGAEKTLGESMKAITAWLAKRGVGVAQGAAVEGAEEGLTSLGQSGTQLAFDAATGSELFDPNKQVPQGGVVGEVFSRALEAAAGGAIGGGLIGGVRGIETRGGKTPAPAQPATSPDLPDAQIDEADLEALTAPPIDPTAPPVEPVSEPVDPNTPEGAADIATEVLTQKADELDEDLAALSQLDEEVVTDEVDRVEKALQGYRETEEFDDEQLEAMRPFFEEIYNLDDELAAITSKEAKDSLGILKKKYSQRKKDIGKRRKEIDKAISDIAEGNFARASAAAVVEEDLPELMADLADVATPVVAAEPEPVMGEAVTEEVVTPTEVATQEEVVAPTNVEEKEEKVVKALRVNGVFYIDENGDVSKELRDKLDKAKSEKNLKELDDIYNSVRVVLNGPSQARGQKTVEQFKAIKSELEDFANQLKQTNKKDEKEKSANLLNWREVYKKADPYQKASILREIARSGTEKELSDVLDMLVKRSVEEGNIALEVANRTKSRDTFERAVSNRALKKSTTPENIDFLRSKKFGDNTKAIPTEIAAKEDNVLDVINGKLNRESSKSVLDLENELNKLKSERTRFLIEGGRVGSSFDINLETKIWRIEREIKKEEDNLFSIRKSIVEKSINDGSLKSYIENGDISAEDARLNLIGNGIDIPNWLQSIVNEVKIKRESSNKSILNRTTDLLGSEKEAYMIASNDKSLLDKESKDYVKYHVIKAIEKDLFQKSVKEGRMTENDVNYIIDSWGLKSKKSVKPKEEKPVKQTNKKDEKEPVLEGVQGRRDEGEGRKESAELRTQEAKQEEVAPPLSEQGKADVGGSNTPTVSDFEVISAKGEKGRKARAELTKRLGKDTVNDMTRITANFESIINNLETQGKIRKECP